MTTRSQVVGGVKIADLDQRLFVYASEAARRALEGHADLDIYGATQMATAIGETYEWLARSAVAKVSPTLLAMPNHQPSLIALAGAAPTSLEAGALKTLGITEVGKLLAVLYPAAELRKTSPDRVLNVRNAAAHMALTDADATHAALEDLTALVKALLDALGRTEEHFWGDQNVETVVAMREGRLKRIEAAVRRKIAAARARFDDLVAGLEEAERLRVIAALDTRGHRVLTPSDEEDHREPCLACPGQALVVYTRTPGADDEREEEDGHWLRPVWLDVESLTCPVCDLELDYEELQSESRYHFAEQSETPIVEEFEEYDPDWKEFSGR